MEETSTTIWILKQDCPIPGKNIPDWRQNLNPTISGQILQERIWGSQVMPNYQVGEDENPRYESQAHDTPGKAIVDISKCQLTTSKDSVQNKGLNFATTIKRIPC